MSFPFPIADQTHPAEIAYDTADLRLARWGASLCYRDPGGWTLRLRVSDASVDAPPAHVERTFADGPGTVPAAALELATGLLRGAAVAPIAALGPRAADPPLAVPTLDGGASAGDLFRVAFAGATERLIRSDAELRRPSADPEPVHRARVAVRRLRSLLRSFGAILEPGWATALAERLRWLGDALGGSRDADVLSEHLRERAALLPSGDRAALDALLARFAERREDAYHSLAQALHDPRYVPLLDALVAAVAAPSFAPRALAPAAEVVPELLAASWRKLRNAVRRRSRPPADAELHRIRICAKRMRYVAEAVVPTAGAAARHFARRVEGLQSVLGDQHDAVVAYQRLQELAANAGLAFVAGELAALAVIAAKAGRRGWHATYRAARRRRFWSST